ncbi:MAG: error-prone DNA polymerase [Clostridia bacterium]|nr:error-prone DNA polymerase [Deltaproteobacteria bacterium]
MVHARASRMSYAPLWCKTNYSFLRAASHPDEMVTSAQMLGLSFLAVTDIDGVYGVVRAHARAKEVGIHLIIGSQVTIDDGSHLVLLAMDRRGYGNLCQLISVGRMRCVKGESRVRWNEVTARSEGLIALWGGEGSALAAVRDDDLDAKAETLHRAFGDRLYGYLTRHREAADGPREERLRKRARRFGLQVVAGYEALYHTIARRPLHDVLTCVRHGVTLATAGTHIRANAEHALMSPASMQTLYSDDSAALERSLEVASRCNFNLQELRYRYPSERLGDGSTSAERLRAFCMEGIAYRYPDGAPAKAFTQIDKELSVIEDLDYCGYFLSMHDIICFCRSKKILCQGRGSAANSIVCYLLGITAVDPVKHDLLFERFISRERAEAPDIDLDIAHARREEVIQHIYAKYGRTHAAMVANIIRYRARSALRDVGKTLGIPETTLDRVSKLLNYHGDFDSSVFESLQLDPSLPAYRQLIELASELDDFPRHLSIHPGGFLLGHEAVADIVPIENGTMEDRTVVQWDKDDMEELGLFKVDILGLGALTQLDLTFELIAKHHDVKLDMATIPADDPKTFDMICEADTVGVFQIESRAQMSMLPRLRPRVLYDLVIEVSIVRPGPITGGMVHPYLRRRTGEEPVDYPHESLEPVLKKTLGVPLFQEQVMRIAVIAADYSPGEADQLRRDMAAWRRSGRIDKHRERIRSAMLNKGISEEFAERVFNQIRGFGSYGFPESHAASFALISYASSYLKCHYPAAFACGLLNAQPMGFYAPATIIEDAKRHGVEVLPIDVCVSDWFCTLERTPSGASGEVAPAIRMGLRYIRGMREEQAIKLIEERHRKPFTSLGELVTRTASGEARIKKKKKKVNQSMAPVVPMPTLMAATKDAKATVANDDAMLDPDYAFTDSPYNAGPLHEEMEVEDAKTPVPIDSEVLTTLAESGAFDRLAPSRREAIWDVRGFVRSRVLPLPLVHDEQTPMFQPLDFSSIVNWDYRSISHSPRGHPLEGVREALRAQKLPDAAAVRRKRDGERVRYAGLVICRQRPGTARGVVFMTLEDETGFVNVVIWSDVFAEFTLLAKTVVFLGVSGTVQSQKSVVHIVAKKLWVPILAQEPETLPSRDFH